MHVKPIRFASLFIQNNTNFVNVISGVTCITRKCPELSANKEDADGELMITFSLYLMVEIHQLN